SQSTNRGACMWISVVRRSALVVFALLLPGSLVAQRYHRTDLTVDMQAVSPSAPNVDSNLVNAWGLSRGTGSPWWVSDNGTGVSTLYDAAGVPVIVPPISGTVPLVVTIPPAKEGETSTPTGTVFNYTTGFEVAPGKKSIFLFVTEDGTISGWNPGVKPKESVIMVN